MTESGNQKKKQGHLSTYPVSRLAPPFDLIDLARDIAKADDMLSLQTEGKLRLLAEQIRNLQDEALKILQETKKNQDLHRAECGFQKRVGHVYHLYRKEGDTLFFSMISPEEWGDRLTHAYVGSYRLEPDMSWTEVG